MNLTGPNLGKALDLARDITVAAVGRPDSISAVINDEAVAKIYKTVFNQIKEIINENLSGK